MSRLTDDEKQFIRGNLEQLSIRELSRHLKRAPKTVSGFIKRNGLTAKPYGFTDAEITSIKSMLQHHTVREIAESINRTEGSVAQFVRRLTGHAVFSCTKDSPRTEYREALRDTKTAIKTAREKAVKTLREHVSTIDPEQEDLITPLEAGGLFSPPKTSREIRLFASYGVETNRGRVRLDFVMKHKMVLTTAEAVERFKSETGLA